MASPTEPSALVLAAKDGYALAARLFGAEDLGSAKALLVVGPATGAPQRYYWRFARWFAGRGYAVLTFDYRGVGLSRLGSLRGFEADFVTWAERDLSAVLDWGLEHHPRVVMVGHSFGGQAWTMVPQARRTLGLVTFGTGTGWMGYMHVKEHPRLHLLWTFLGPFLVSLLGYLPSALLGLGESLPRGVYRQWRRWCARPRHFFDDPDSGMARRGATVNRPVVAVTAVDDPWAPLPSVKAFMSGLPAAPVRYEVVDPQTLGVSAIGHVAYFDKNVGARLWPLVEGWVEELLAFPAA
ncbi:MAG: alpha/beta fold hydrolase [Candidatus Sericytochromatia bacterium]|nr:alpha/beta fold hydrolase [Candidatus Sericytochromatia bacterium]